MKLYDDAISRIEAVVPEARAERSGMCVLVKARLGACTYIMPESLEGLTDDQVKQLVTGMLKGARK